MSGTTSLMAQALAMQLVNDPVGMARKLQVEQREAKKTEENIQKESQSLRKKYDGNQPRYDKRPVAPKQEHRRFGR
jgi:hypothetical protein